jgi:thiamine biosynthesis protein ThiS
MSQKIKVNQEFFEYYENMTVQHLLDQMKYPHPLFFIRVDGKVVEQQNYHCTTLFSHSDVKIVPLIAGG